MWLLSKPSVLCFSEPTTINALGSHLVAGPEIQNKVHTRWALNVGLEWCQQCKALRSGNEKFFVQHFIVPVLITAILLWLEALQPGVELHDNLVCPYDDERLYYNIDIYVEGMAEGYNEYDLIGLGKVLQRLVDEVEEEIPEYSMYSMS